MNAEISNKPLDKKIEEYFAKELRDDVVYVLAVSKSKSEVFISEDSEFGPPLPVGGTIGEEQKLTSVTFGSSCTDTYYTNADGQTCFLLGPFKRHDGVEYRVVCR